MENKKYFVWATPGSGKTHCYCNYENVDEYDSPIDCPSEIPTIMNDDYGKPREVYMSPLVDNWMWFGEKALEKRHRFFWKEPNTVWGQLALRRREEENFEILLVYPSIECVEEYVERYKKRGDDAWRRAFLRKDLINTVDAIEGYNANPLFEFNHKQIILKKGQFLDKALIENGVPLIHATKKRAPKVLTFAD